MNKHILKGLGVGIHSVKGVLVKPKKFVKQNEIRYDLVFTLNKEHALGRHLIKGILDLMMDEFCKELKKQDFKSVKAKYYE